jgi:hypothetical protein
MSDISNLLNPQLPPDVIAAFDASRERMKQVKAAVVALKAAGYPAADLEKMVSETERAHVILDGLIRGRK